MKNTSISLGDYFDNFVSRQISVGRYKNVSEVVRAGLRLLDDEESKIGTLKKAIQEGIDSGIAHNFNPDTHLHELKSKRKKNAQNL
jgi:antitoxin ParD1/3/4